MSGRCFSEPGAIIGLSSNFSVHLSIWRLFRDALDAYLLTHNADYLAHRANDIVLPPPAIVSARAGGFDAWMRRRGKLGGQNKVPRMDGSGELACDLVGFCGEGVGSTARFWRGHLAQATGRMTEPEDVIRARSRRPEIRRRTFFERSGRQSAGLCRDARHRLHRLRQ